MQLTLSPAWAYRVSVISGPTVEGRPLRKVASRAWPRFRSSPRLLPEALRAKGVASPWKKPLSERHGRG